VPDEAIDDCFCGQWRVLRPTGHSILMDAISFEDDKPRFGHDRMLVVAEKNAFDDRTDRTVSAHRSSLDGVTWSGQCLTAVGLERPVPRRRRPGAASVSPPSTIAEA
jgi:hypothetical protein